MLSVRNSLLAAMALALAPAVARADFAGFTYDYAINGATVLDFAGNPTPAISGTTTSQALAVCLGPAYGCSDNSGVSFFTVLLNGADPNSGIIYFVGYGSTYGGAAPFTVSLSNFHLDSGQTIESITPRANNTFGIGTVELASFIDGTATFQASTPTGYYAGYGDAYQVVFDVALSPLADVDEPAAALLLVSGLAATMLVSKRRKPLAVG